MKKLVLAVAIVVIGLVAIAGKNPVTDVLPESYGEVVFVRSESEGKLNIVPAFITCDMWQRLVVSGGQVASVYLADGDYEFQALSRSSALSMVKRERRSSHRACRPPDGRSSAPEPPATIRPLPHMTPAIQRPSSFLVAVAHR